MTKKISTFVFWGAVWGIAEATIGWLLHAMHIHAVGFWMYPIALTCMMAAYRSTGRVSWICYVAVVAGLVKLIDLLLPVPAYHIINPAIHIMLEGVGVAMFVKLASNRTLSLPVSYLVAFGCLLVSGYAWRLWQLGASVLWVHNPGAQMFWTTERMLPWLGQWLILSALVVLAYRFVTRFNVEALNRHYSLKWALGSMTIALAVTFFID